MFWLIQWWLMTHLLSLLDSYWISQQTTQWFRALGNKRHLYNKHINKPQTSDELFNSSPVDAAPHLRPRDPDYTHTTHFNDVYVRGYENVWNGRSVICKTCNHSAEADARVLHVIASTRTRLKRKENVGRGVIAAPRIVWALKLTSLDPKGQIWGVVYRSPWQPHHHIHT